MTAARAGRCHRTAPLLSQAWGARRRLCNKDWGFGPLGQRQLSPHKQLGDVGALHTHRARKFCPHRPDTEASAPQFTCGSVMGAC